MKYLTVIITALLILTANTAIAQSNNDQAVYELRIYTTNEGKLDALHARFRDHTIKIFNKYSMESIGYWTPADKPNTLIYIIKHKSMDAAKKSWHDFSEDADWKIVAVETNKNGPILAAPPQSTYMYATDYSLNFLK